MAGKTHRRWLRVYVDDNAGLPKDLSGDSTDVVIPESYDTEDVTGLSDSVMHEEVGQPSKEVVLTGVYNAAADRSFDVLTGILGQVSSSVTVTVEYGSKAVPIAGDPSFSGEFFLSELVFDGALKFTATFVPATATAPAWGVKS